MITTAAKKERVHTRFTMTVSSGSRKLASLSIVGVGLSEELGNNSIDVVVIVKVDIL